MLGGRKITATITGETLEGFVVKGNSPYNCEACLKTKSQRD
jgi:hypothetical protein